MHHDFILVLGLVIIVVYDIQIFFPIDVVENGMLYRFYGKIGCDMVMDWSGECVKVHLR